MRYKARHAFTLIEILVVLGIVGILIALVLPAAMAARQAARKLHCSNNMRQFGMSLHNYSDKHRVFPRGDSGWGFSLHAMLLPELDQTPVFNSINFGVKAPFVNIAGDPNQTVFEMSISVFLCPSDAFQVVSGYGRTSYGGNGGYGLLDRASFGVFGDSNPAVAPAVGDQSIQDGTSQTAALSEWGVGIGDTRNRDPLVAIFDTPNLVGTNKLERFVRLCRDVDVDVSRPIAGKKSRWICGGFGDSLLNFALLPGEHGCLNAGSVNTGLFSAGSRHAAGVNVLFVDGHVTFVGSSVDQSTWRALGTRSGGEIVSGTDY